MKSKNKPASPPSNASSGSQLTWFLRGAAGLFSVPALVLITSFVGFAGLALESGISFEHTVFMTATIWALPSQIVLVGAIAAGSSLATAAFAVVLVSVRFTPMVAAWVPVVRDETTSRTQLILLSHFVAITAWVFAMSRLPNIERSARRAYFAGFAITLTLINIVVTAIAYQAAAQMPLMAVGALFMLTPVYFLFSLWRAAKERGELLALGIGVTLGPVLVFWWPDFALILTGLVGGTLAYVLGRRWKHSVPTALTDPK